MKLSSTKEALDCWKAIKGKKKYTRRKPRKQTYLENQGNKQINDENNWDKIPGNKI